MNTVPEAIVRGVQWEIGQAIASETRVRAAKAYAREVKIRKERAKVEESRRKEREKADLPSEYPFLTPMSETPGKSVWAAGAANLRKHLKWAFPDVKFSVKSSSFANGCSIDIAWTDGPISTEVAKIAESYSYRYSHEAFSSVFGGAKYIGTNRTISDEAFSRVAAEMGWPEASRDHKFSGFTGCEIDTGEVIQRECWQRSFDNE
jgi:hypothetical protein